MFRWFEKLTTPFPMQEPTQPPKSLFAFCRHYTKGFEKPLVIMSLLSACVAIAEVTLIRYMGQLVDILGSQSRETFWTDQTETLWTMALLVCVVMPCLAFFHSMIMHQTLLGNYPMSIRWLVHRYLLKQSVGFFQRDFAGRVATKVMQSSLAVRETVMKLVDVMVYISVYFVSMVWMMGESDQVLMLPILIWLLVYIAIQFYYIPRMKQVATDQADARSQMTGRIVDSYTNITTVKLFSHSERELAYAENSMQQFLQTVYRQMRMVTCLLFSVDAINYLLLFSIAALSINLWLDEAVTVGVIAIAISIALRVQGMSKWIMWELSALFENIGTVVDGMNTISNEVEIKDTPRATPLQVSRGAIAFNAVDFRYSDEVRVFNQLNLQLKPGEKVGIVGRSGAGKSSLVNLLLRFYDVNAGNITIDDQDIALVTQESLRHQIGMITQDTSLLHRTIRENILYGAPDSSEEAMIEAAKQAHAHDFIVSLRDEQGRAGYDVEVGERGVKLSGGQRQRIAIARVLLKNAPILIMDEATSALDSEVESAIQENLEVLMQGKTVIAIAHRLSTIAAMDRLIVMDKGEIVEQGSHQELLAKQGIYAQLWAHQTGGFLGEK
ncbi:multidrug ABC transporter ATP-binding protein [Vibrio navarrensis]|uniref:ABC transporter ATP-binding protein n=1 Tax=Vibrio navarrensis TaxID=29495 RepID=A0AAI9CRU3_9VIBR|nr:ABC transporter ATP-binding protein [Vibrio navarrensis]EGR2797318.1 ABC transporter ATP-binding protein [Vibrio navarrensis]EHA1126333.1 ABC transporter ATP-binding protein [Vibrio navarrensis]EJL6393754.1 ABC transporter ATP-binding protein [Vibrio navarrensis]EKA5635362.1 ABC transporter ATP-binding protein [Vibrio navarrensis]ELN6931413.1 ABC transporter ATP-binding protein [Vibrio navarrensis]